MLDGDSLGAPKSDSPRVTMRGHIAYATVVALSILACSRELIALVLYAWNHDSSSQLLFIPAISLYLTWLERKRIFAMTRFSIVPGATAILGGGVLFCLGRWEALRPPGNEALCVSALSVVIIWTGAFLLCYGSTTLRAAAFHSVFLLLMIPIPDPVLEGIIQLLQRGSTEIAWL